ncbi:MAG: formyl transferase [Paludibacter sp.]|nr:formyl transferase [Paludibacter sp.]
MAKLKIVVLIGTPVYLNYFVNRIAEDHTLELVIRENSRSNLIKKILKKGILKSCFIILAHLANKKKTTKEYNRILGNKWTALTVKTPLITVENINSPQVKDQLEKIKPDLVVVQGTTMIKSTTIKNIPLVLNLHWGLSPYYRGSYCTEWAILNHDIYNIGYTIHKISSKIDGGAILTQGRPEIEAIDTSNSINMKLTKQGADKMSEVITKIKDGEQPQFIKQETDKGKLYLIRNWTSKERKKLKYMESEGLLTQMSNNPKNCHKIIHW